MNQLHYIVKQDGDKWCAHYSNFTNMQESEIAFGDTPWEAIKNFVLRGTSLATQTPETIVGGSDE